MHRKSQGICSNIDSDYFIYEVVLLCIHSWVTNPSIPLPYSPFLFPSPNHHSVAWGNQFTCLGNIFTINGFLVHNSGAFW